jgi:polyphosphate kinase 2 (PPK2 family)
VSKSGLEIGHEHVGVVQAFLDELWERQEPLPRRAGKPNLTRIAAACGFDRGVFYSNEGVERALKAYEEKDRIRFYDKLEQAEQKRERSEAATKYDRGMVERVIELEALVTSQARELERLRRLEAMMCKEGVLPP